MIDYTILDQVLSFSKTTGGALIAQDPSLCRQALLGAMAMLGLAAVGSSAQSTDREAEATVTVRYIVKDVPESVEFYTRHLGFAIALDAGPAFAIVARGALRLALSGTAGSGGGSRAMPDGRKPEPGGWNRIQIPIGDLAAEVAHMRAAGLHFRNDIVKGNGGLLILLDDPSGNPIEPFQGY
jgi:catechol 2,3-dioxygenase-like lactoylglutathione lyase family enzyme